MLLRVWEIVRRHTDRYAENREGIKSGAYISYPSAGEKTWEVHLCPVCANCCTQMLPGSAGIQEREIYEWIL